MQVSEYPVLKYLKDTLDSFMTSAMQSLVTLALKVTLSSRKYSTPKGDAKELYRVPYTVRLYSVVFFGV